MIGAQECSTSYGLEPIPWHRCGQRAFRASSGPRTRHAAFRRRANAASSTDGAGSIETASAEAGSTAHDPPARGKARRFASSWDAKEASAEAGSKEDYLSNLGTAQDYNINVSHGQNIAHIDSLFAGKTLGHESDIADGSLRGYEFRSLANIVGDYYVSPRFLDAVAMHLVKNMLMDRGVFDAQIRVPLILGVWGGKGQGKTFQTELALKKLGVEPIIMSAGELEHEWAGTPGRLIRERYRRAAEHAKNRGKMPCLIINDIDAGIGIQANVQRTVNNQNVFGTLMNIADNPNRVSIAQIWRENDVIGRVPIIVTGNDFSTLFAPLIRDGRMTKFYWQPSREDLVNILYQMYKDDALTPADMGALLDTFPGQPLDFYGALRSATYDGQIRAWIRDEVVQGDISAEDANMKELTRRLINREGLPTFKPVELRLEDLVAEGRRLAQEQEHVNNFKLSEEYMRGTNKGGGGTLVGFGG